MNQNIQSTPWQIIKPLLALGSGLVALILTLWSVSLVHAADPVLTRHPFIALQNLTSTTIIWHTDVATTSQLDYGTSLAYGSTLSNSTPLTTHIFQIPNLLTDTQYFYRTKAGGITLTESLDYYFNTTPDPISSTFTFVAMGDGGESTSEQKTLAARIREISPSLVIYTGDVYYGGSVSNGCPIASNYQCTFYDIYSDTLKNAPIYVTPGDHDYEDLSNNEYMTTFSYLYTSTNLSAAYYAVEYGNALFITVNSDAGKTYLDPGNNMYNFIEQQLSSSTKFWKFVYFDKPLYMSGSKRGSVNYVSMRNNLSPLFEQYNVDIVFGGDAHVYERSLPINEYFPSSRGTIYIVTGGGGVDSLTSAGWDWWTAYAKSIYHITRIDINNCQLTLQAIDQSGSVFDTFTINRCP